MTVSVTNGTFDENERVSIVNEKSVQEVPLLIADLTGRRQLINFSQFLASDIATRTGVGIDICGK